jgi:hypothetical protein
MIRNAITLSPLFFAVLISLPAADTSYESLRGLRSMGVAISGDCEIGDLTCEQLQTDVELRLRQNGITVVRDVRLSPGRPTLQVGLGFYDVAKGNERINGYSFAVLFELRQDVYLSRNKASMEASTWSKLVVGATNRDAVKDHVRRVVGELVDRFINDFLSVNPK